MKLIDLNYMIHDLNNKALDDRWARKEYMRNFFHSKLLTQLCPNYKVQKINTNFFYVHV